VGDAVEAGDTLARIDDREWRLQLRDDEAEIKRLEASQLFLETQLRRLEKLAQQNNAARTQLDESRSQIAMGEQDIARARVARERTRQLIERTEIKAPFAGRVTERMASIGEYTSVGAPMLRLVDTFNVEVRAQAPVNIARFLADGMAVTVRDDRGRSDSVIRSVVGVGDERSRMIEVRVALDGGAWIIGSAVRVELPQSEPALVVAVPRDALILREDSTYVYKLTDESTVEQVPVRTGMGNGSMIQVTGAVAHGDRVVVRGGERLRAGQSVVIAQDS
jgi:RND family efflux transporter MFP subunit